MAAKAYATQIWPFRESFGADMVRTLERIAAIGFAGVELCRWFDWTDLFDKWPAEDLYKTSQRLGLKIVSAHIPYYMILPDRLGEMADFSQAVGMKYAIVASLPKEQFASLAALLSVVETFNQAASSLKTHGIRTGYHCHGGDFVPVEGQIPWDVLFDNTDADVVMQLDIGNALQGGVDPIAYLKKYPGRASLVHLKEFSARKQPEAIGDGEVDWMEVMTICESLHHPEWYIIEQEEEAYDPYISAEKSLKYLRSLGY